MAETTVIQARVKERWGSLGKEWSFQSGEIIYYYAPSNPSVKVTVKKNGNKRIVDGGGATGSLFAKYEYNANDLKKTTNASLPFTVEDFGDNAFLFDYLNRQAASIKKQKVWDGFNFIPDTNFDSFPDNSIFLGEWTSNKIINGIPETTSPPYFGISPDANSLDKKYRSKFGVRPPYWEILQVPYVDKKEPVLREFGTKGKNLYYLNNDSYVEIEWIDINGDGPLLEFVKFESSDNWGRELDITDITNTTNYKIGNIIKKATIYPKNDDPISLSEEVKETFDGSATSSIRTDKGFLYVKDLESPHEQKIWKGTSKAYPNNGILDHEILSEILFKWRESYGNKKSKFDYFFDYDSKDLSTPNNKLLLPKVYSTSPGKSDQKYITPVLSVVKVVATGVSGASGASGASGSLFAATAGTGGTGATGTSASVTPKRERVNGLYIFDVRRAGFLINYGTGGTGPGLTSSGLGELEILEKFTIDDPFNVPFEDDVTGADPEYSEAYYEGPEEDLDLVTGVAFTAEELLRDETSVVAQESPKEEQKAAGVEFGGSSVKSPSGDVSSSSVSLPTELAGVQNSKIITQQSMGNGYRSIASDITAPSGAKLSGSEICQNMNKFVQDALGPFAKWLKSKYPDLYKGWYITSATRGYVPSGGSLTSQHMKGQAIDSQILGATKSKPEKNIQLCNAILEWYQSNPIGYGQILFETRDKGSCWIHWSYTRGNTRLQFVRFSNDSTKSAPANKTGAYVLPTLTKASLAL